ncbi:MAG: DUF4175 family protein [Planctomycetes bacterium]|nr:DUF4175 family protein [Planctomycetota bacterium]
MNAGTTSPPRPERALARIRALRFRRRRIRAADGFLRLGVVVVLLIWATFLLDWSLDLPLGIRVINIVAALTFILLALRVFVLTTRRRVSDAWLAGRIESASDLEQSLITAVQLAAEDNPRRQNYSAYLLERTVREAEEKIANVDTASLVSARGLTTTLLFLLVLTAPLAVGAAIRGDLADAYLKRNVLFRRVPWPRSYFLEIDQPTDLRTLIAMGDPLSVVARKVRGGDARVVLEAMFSDGGREEFPLERLERNGVDTYRKVFGNVTRDFRFRVRCGDFRSEFHEVLVRNRPRIEEISLQFDYPDYTGLDKLSSDGASSERNLGGHVKVPVGTIVHYDATTSIPVGKAVFVEEYSAGGERHADRLDLEIGGGTKIAGSFEAQRDGTYHFELTSEDGFENPSPIRYRVAVIPDQPPIVQVLAPGRNTEVSTRAQFPMSIVATDDYGLVQGRIVFRRETSEPGGEESGAATHRNETPPLATIDLDAFGKGATKAEVGPTIDVEPMQLVEGQRIEYVVEAFDAIQQLGTSRRYVLTIVAEDELMRILQDELSLVRESLEQCLEWQREGREEIESIADAMSPSAKVLEKDLPSVRQSRLTQDRVGERLEESVGRVAEIIARARENRLVWKELARVEGVRSRLDTIATELAPPALEGLNTLVSAGRESTREAILGVVEKQLVVERTLRDLLVDLREWGDLRSLIRKVEELIGTQRQLEEHVKEKVRESLGPGAAPPRGEQ